MCPDCILLPHRSCAHMLTVFAGGTDTDEVRHWPPDKSLARQCLLCMVGIPVTGGGGRNSVNTISDPISLTRFRSGH
jgi:hypothetical protein